MILIVGAGIAGLSTAYHLRNEDYHIYEKEGEVGGLCRSFKKDGFTFDFTGHLLHLRSEYASKLLEKLLPDRLKTHFRRASIYSKSVFTPYPFQANLYGLPKEVIKECVVGFVEAKEAREELYKIGANNANDSGISFKDWIVNTFGSGIANHFMIPYNEKMWKSDLSEVSSEWVDWSIPVPRLDEVIAGALGIENPRMGYSAQFLYPEKEGIEILPRAFLPHVNNINYNRKLTAVDLHEKRVWFDDNSSIEYDRLVSTIPLPELLDSIENLPQSISELRHTLRHISVLNVNLGIEARTVSDQHWIYFPEKEIPFYRVGLYTNFSSELAPAKCSSLYVEVSYLPGDSLNQPDALERVYDGLKACGLLKNKDHIIVENIIDIPYAYVIHDDSRCKNLPKIMDYLNKHDIFSIGRYGGWQYMSMEDALLQGKELAESIHE
jgi:protoporphyrinogen oxidase